MNGLALMITVDSQVVVASMKAIDFGVPSGSSAQARVAHTAMSSSQTTPAAATCRRCRRSVSFQTSLVSV